MSEPSGQNWIQAIRRFFDRDWTWSGIVFAVSFLTYLVTLPQTPSFEDSAEFVTAAMTLSVPHPSGYPLYVLLAHPFSCLPFGTGPWRVAIFSALCAALALMLAHALAIKLVRALRLDVTLPLRLAMAAVVTASGLGSVYWSQSIHAEVYALHALLTLLTLWLIVLSVTDKRQRWPVLAAFVFGLSLANHISMALAQAPFLLLAAVLARPDFFRLRNWRYWLAALGAVAVGALPSYLWLLWRSQNGELMLMGSAMHSWGDLVNYVYRTSYADLVPGSRGKFAIISVMLADFWSYAGWSVMLLMLVGAGLSLYRGGRLGRVVFFGLLAGVLAAPLAMILRSMDYHNLMFYTVRVYGIAAYPLAGTAAAVGAAWLVGVLHRKGSRFGRARLVLVTVVVAVLVALPVCQAWQSRFAVKAYRSPFSYLVAKDTLASLLPNAVLIVSDGMLTHDAEIFNLMYLQRVEGYRTDVTVLSDTTDAVKAKMGLIWKTPPEKTAYRRDILTAIIADSQYQGRPIYSTFPGELTGATTQPKDNGYIFTLKPEATVRSETNGLVFSLKQAGRPSGFATAPSAADAAGATSLTPDASTLAANMALSQQAVHLLYLQAALDLQRSDWTASKQAFIKAIALDQETLSPDYIGFLLFRQAWGGDEAGGAGGGRRPANRRLN